MDAVARRDTRGTAIALGMAGRGASGQGSWGVGGRTCGCTRLLRTAERARYASRDPIVAIVCSLTLWDTHRAPRMVVDALLKNRNCNVSRQLVLDVLRQKSPRSLALRSLLLLIFFRSESEKTVRKAKSDRSVRACSAVRAPLVLRFRGAAHWSPAPVPLLVSLSDWHSAGKSTADGHCTRQRRRKPRRRELVSTLQA